MSWGEYIQVTGFMKENVKLSKNDFMVGNDWKHFDTKCRKIGETKLVIFFAYIHMLSSVMLVLWNSYM